MKKRIVVFIAALMALMFTLGFSALTVSAEESSPSVSIEKFNLAFENDTHLKYAVKFTGIDDSEINYNNIGMLYWTDYDGGFTPGTENYSSKTTGYTMIDEEKYYAFEYDNLAAKQLTDYVYSIAYLEYGGETYYSEPVKYSALEYAYNRLGKTDEGSTDAELKALLNNMLDYGASAQEYFDYKEDRLATKDFYQLTLVGGTLDDGFTSGLYLSTDEVTITAPAELDGKGFTAWQNSVGETVSTDNPAIITNFTTNETYTATYTETSTYSEGLKYTLNDDGESYSVTGIGTCTDTEVIIPSMYEGKPVTAIGEYALNDDTLKSVVIPDSVISIDDFAFWYNTCIESVIMGDSVMSIGDQAFYHCSSLKSITISENLTSIGYWTFMGCSALVNVTLPDSITSIGHESFSGCSSLASINIPNNLQIIEAGLFHVCESLTSIYIPEGVNEIQTNEYHGSPFLGCWALETIEVADANTAYQSIDGSLYTKDGKTLIQYACGKTDSSFTVPETVTSISLGAFMFCQNITSITIPDNVMDIGSAAFAYCSKLTDVSIGAGVTSIGLSAFDDTGYYNNSSNWENNVLYIDKYLIRAKDTISGEYVIKDGTKVISDGAFLECENLTNVIISDSVTSIGEYAFSNCDSLTDTYYKGTKDSWKLISISNYNDPLTNATRYYYSETEPTTEGYFWHYVDGVPTVWPVYIDPSIKYSDGLEYTSNGDGTCYVSGIGTCSDTDIVIPSTSPEGWRVTSIGDSAFKYCLRITSIVIPESVTSIGDSALYLCLSLNNISVDERNEHYKSIDGNLYSKDGKELIQYAIRKTDTEFIIPDSVMSIGKYAFAGGTSITNITIPNSVTTIGERAFYQCNALTTLKIPDSVITIGAYAFDACENLFSVVIGSNVKVIGDGAFLDTWRLVEVINKSSLNLKKGFSENGMVAKYAIEIHGGESKLINIDNYFFYVYEGNNYLVGYAGNDIELVLPESFYGEKYVINQYAFYECYTFESLVLSDGVRSIGDYAFSRCYSININLDGTATSYGLKNVVIGDNVTVVGKSAFAYCYALENVSFGNSITNIETEAFYMCDKIKELILPNSLVSIGSYAFRDCDLLTKIDIPSHVTNIGDSAFRFCDNLIAMSLPKSLVTIGEGAFYGCDALTDIYYIGTAEEWTKISIGSDNSDLTKSYIHYNYVPEE